jgi:hypothetical protein
MIIYIIMIIGGATNKDNVFYIILYNNILYKISLMIFYISGWERVPPRMVRILSAGEVWTIGPSPFLPYILRGESVGQSWGRGVDRGSCRGEKATGGGCLSSFLLLVPLIMACHIRQKVI